MSKISIDPGERILELSNIAIKLSEIDYKIPLFRYFRASKELIRTAQFYTIDNSLENAFILYSKYITLFVEKFPKHPDYKLITPSERKIFNRNLEECFSAAEALKKQLSSLYLKQNEELEAVKINLEKDSELEERFDALRKNKQPCLQNSYNTIVLEKKDVCNDTIRYIYPEAKTIISSFENNNTSVFTQSPKQIPLFDRSLKPYSKYDESQIRNVIIPVDLTDKFLLKVKLNTESNIETCGVLCGTLQKNKWKITHVLIPKQHGASDSCDIENDEDIVQFQDDHNIITLGWIHTHPSQTAFLSSVDQHTHWPYQKLFPEAIAVVCSPKFNETGYFNLTLNFGMGFIQDCKGSGFHEHPFQPPIFQICQHVEFDNLSSILIHDLR